MLISAIAFYAWFVYRFVLPYCCIAKFRWFCCYCCCLFPIQIWRWMILYWGLRTSICLWIVNLEWCEEVEKKYEGKNEWINRKVRKVSSCCHFKQLFRFSSRILIIPIPYPYPPVRILSLVDGKMAEEEIITKFNIKICFSWV